MSASTAIGVFLTWWPTSRWLGLGIMGVTFVYFTVAVGRWIEHRRLTRRPHLSLIIHEAYIQPLENAARCFLRISLHNEIGLTVANPLMSAYSLQFTIKGKTYYHSVALDSESYDLYTYRSFETYENGYQDQEMRVVDTEQMFRVTTSRVDLTRGFPADGWLGFGFHYLPTWPTDKEHSHYEVEYEHERDDEGNPLERIEESAEQVEVFSYHPHVRKVESLMLTVVDAFGKPITASAAISSAIEKRIIRRDVPLDA